MQSIDLEAATTRRVLKALVYGKSGTGKTGFGVSAPKPLILLNEAQAVPHIRDAQRRLNRKVYGVLVMKRLQDYRDVLNALRADRAKPFVVRAADKVIFESKEWPETVVLDSLTEAIDLIAEEIREQSPPKEGKDGLPVDSERFWNVLGDRAAKLIRAFRDVDLNVLYLCLLDRKETGEKETKVVWVGPALTMRRLPGVVQAAVNVVGVTARQLGKNNTSVYGIKTMGPEYVELKPFPPLRAAEVMDFTSWCSRINGVEDGSVAPVLAHDEADIAASDDKAPEKPAAQAAQVNGESKGKATTDKPAQAAAEGAQ